MRNLLAEAEPVILSPSLKRLVSSSSRVRPMMRKMASRGTDSALDEGMWSVRQQAY